jgi:hypothetical protein
MKAYTTPALVAKGSVVALTQGQFIDVTDPDQRTMAVSIGGIGFGL